MLTSSKHMAVLRETRIVVQGRNRLYQLDPRLIADKSQCLSTSAGACCA